LAAVTLGMLVWGGVDPGWYVSSGHVRSWGHSGVLVRRPRAAVGARGVETLGVICQAATCGRGGRSDPSSSGHVRSWRREGDDPRGRPAKRPRAVVEAWLSSRQAATCDRGGEGCVIPGEICQAATCGRGGRRNSPSSGHVRSWGRDGVDPRRRSVKRPRAVVGAGAIPRQAATCGRGGGMVSTSGEDLSSGHVRSWGRESFLAKRPRAVVRAPSAVLPRHTSSLASHLLRYGLVLPQCGPWLCVCSVVVARLVLGARGKA
jgi:hypothetical protein